MEALKTLLYKMADDQMIIGHRNSEWTGLGPILEEDIAFASMAQDKIGHALALYTILHEELGEKDPDTNAFSRKPSEWKNSILNEVPSDDYGFSLVRHFLFDNLEMIRFNNFKTSSHDGLKMLANKFNGEIKYHIMHGDLWMKQLAEGGETAKARVQTAINECFELVGGLFESFEGEQALIDAGVYAGEEAMKNEWLTKITAVLEELGFTVPAIGEKGNGGINGNHTEGLDQLLNEMTEVYQLDPSTEW